jgi:hypothetical protein
MEMTDMSMTTETHKTTRQRRFSRAYVNEEGAELDEDKLVVGETAESNGEIQVRSVIVKVDGQPIKFDLDLGQGTLIKLACEALYERLTRSVHAAKPVASDTESAVKVMEATYAAIKTGTAKKGRRGGGGGRAFDVDAFKVRFKNALIAGAKGNNIKFTEPKVDNIVNIMVGKSGKERQEILQKKYLKDPYFKIVWDKPIIEKKKAQIKAGQVESAFADLM